MKPPHFLQCRMMRINDTVIDSILRTLAIFDSSYFALRFFVLWFVVLCSCNAVEISGGIGNAIGDRVDIKSIVIDSILRTLAIFDSSYFDSSYFALRFFVLWFVVLCSSIVRSLASIVDQTLSETGDAWRSEMLAYIVDWRPETLGCYRRYETLDPTRTIPSISDVGVQ